MLGYVKPAYGELRVREHELYRAAYCGLCRSMGRCTGCLSRMSLSYDFVFLALIRYALTGTRASLASGRCAVHPLKKRAYLTDSEPLDYSSAAAAVLFYEKIRDDVSDERGARRIAASFIKPAAASAAKKAGLPEIKEMAETEIEALSVLEKKRSDDIDAAAETFGRLLAGVLSYGLKGGSARIASEVGRHTGRFVYICDAADDMGDDARRGRYNPFLAAYGKDILEEREVGDFSGRSVRRIVPKRETAEGILAAARLDLMRLEKAESLIDYKAALLIRGIIENIIGIGMPGEMMRALGLIPAGNTETDNVSL